MRSTLFADEFLVLLHRRNRDRYVTNCDYTLLNGYVVLARGEIQQRSFCANVILALVDKVDFVLLAFL